MPSPLEQRLQFAFGLLYDASRWVQQVEGDVPQLMDPLGKARDCISQAQGHIENAKMSARMVHGLLAIASVPECDHDLQPRVGLADVLECTKCGRTFRPNGMPEDAT